MSRIGKLAIPVPNGVTVNVADDVVHVKGPKGELKQQTAHHVAVRVDDGKVVVERTGNEKVHRAAHGLTRTLVNNMVEGVSKGFRKSLELSLIHISEVLGLRGPLACLNEARYGVLWGAMGAARSCYESALEYAKARKQFGRPIAGFQLTQQKLVKMLLELNKGVQMCIRDSK